MWFVINGLGGGHTHTYQRSLMKSFQETRHAWACDLHAPGLTTPDHDYREILCFWFVHDSVVFGLSMAQFVIYNQLACVMRFIHTWAYTNY